MKKREFREPRRRGGFDDDFPFSPPPDLYGGPPMAPRTPRPAMPMASGPAIDATVKWFNPEKGFGFVELSDGSGDAFLHVRAVEAAGHSEVPPGAKLSVRTAQGQKGLQVAEIVEVDLSTATPQGAGSGAGGGFGNRGPRPPRPAGGFGDRGGYGGGGGGYGGGGGGGYGGGGGGRSFDRGPTGPSTEMSGTVKWYNPEKGFGFIAAEDGGKDVFVHRSALARAGISMLNEGQQLRVAVVDGQKGREVSSIISAD